MTDLSPAVSRRTVRNRRHRTKVLFGLLYAIWPELVAGPAAAQEPGGRKRDESAVNKIEYSVPAPEMKRVSVLVGRWTGRQTWREPLRYKRGRYEGYPGPEGHVIRVVEPGPGGFSLVWTDDGRGPMGGYTTRALLSWDPKLRVYVLDAVHSLFPGISRVSAADVQGALVFRGEDESTGEKRSLRVTWTGLSESGWTEEVAASERGGPFRPVVTVKFERVEEPSAAAPPGP